VEKENPLKVPLGIFDSCGQLMLIAGSRFLSKKAFFMVIGWDKLTIFSCPSQGELCWCYFTVPEQETDGDIISAAYTLCDTSGRIYAQAENIQFRVLNEFDPDPALQNAKRKDISGVTKYRYDIV